MTLSPRGDRERGGTSAVDERGSETEIFLFWFDSRDPLKPQARIAATNEYPCDRPCDRRSAFEAIRVASVAQRIRLIDYNRGDIEWKED